MNGTVKQFNDVLEEMRGIYPFNDENTKICTFDVASMNNNRLCIYTVDEKTGIEITMTKRIGKVKEQE